MSSDAREWVWEYSSSRGTARLVLLSIADRVPDEQCAAWASLSSLIERTNASRTAVRDALDKLVTSGELEQRDELQGPQGPRSTACPSPPRSWPRSRPTRKRTRPRGSRKHRRRTRCPN